MHELGRNFVVEVLDVREAHKSTEETAQGHHLQFKAKYEDGSRRHVLKCVFLCLASQMWGYVNIWCIPRGVFCFNSHVPCVRLYLYDRERRVGGTQ